MNLEDETGMINVIISVDTWQANATVARSARALIIEGRLQRRGQVASLSAEHFEPIVLEPTTASRDFR